MDINQFLVNSKLKIIVKPNSAKTEIIRWDDDRQALRVNIKAAPEKGKANMEVIRFFSKKLGKVMIVKGLKSREKVLKLVL